MNPSIWELETFYHHRDIIIVGGGFTGLWSAISIKEKFPEKSVLVVEKNPFPLGASTRNAGFACFGSLTEIISDSETLGWEKTLDLVQMRFSGLRKIQNYFSSQEIDFNLCGGYEILNDDHALQHIDEVNRKLESITGLEKTYQLNQDKLKEFGFGNSQFLIENPCEGSLHSGKLLQKLLEKCYQLNVEFLFGTEISKVEEKENGVEVFISNSETISAEKVVFCTNAFSDNLLPQEDIVPARGQILLTEPIANLRFEGTFHYDEGFYYWRNLGNRVLLGGGRNQDFEGEKTTDFSTSDFLQNHLEHFLKTVILPGQNPKIEMRWSGIMAMGKEKSPIIKQISYRQFAAVRLSGMGVALAPKIGELVADLVK